MSAALVMSVAALGAVLALNSAASAGLFGSRTAQASCGVSVLSPQRYAADVGQVIAVVAATPTSRTATVGLWSRKRNCFVRVGGPWTASIGSDGLSADKHEGDGTTPIGSFSVGARMYGNSTNPGVEYPYHRLLCGDWWDEDPASPTYNRFVHLRCGTTPSFGGGSEALWRVVPQYDYFAVINYNAAPIVSGRGSAIFLHVSDGRSTAGCVALATPHLLTTLLWLRQKLHPVITIALAKSAR